VLLAGTITMVSAEDDPCGNALVAILLMGSVEVAQTTYSVTVHVTDRSGAFLPEASVSASLQGQSGTSTVKTDGHGDAVLQLVPGAYIVRASCSGFYSMWQKVSITGATTLYMELRPGSVGNAPVVIVLPPNIPTEFPQRDALVAEIPMMKCACMRSSGSPGEHPW
jgi:hypothetical protein